MYGVELIDSSRVESVETVYASDEEPYAPCGGIPSQHAHGDVGGIVRLCLLLAVNESGTEHYWIVRVSPHSLTFRWHLLNTLSRTMQHIMVISLEGYFHLYSIDLENGGECSLLEQYRYVGILRVAALLIRVFTFLVYWFWVMNLHFWMRNQGQLNM
jgi:hypothetical protein